MEKYKVNHFWFNFCFVTPLSKKLELNLQRNTTFFNKSILKLKPLLLIVVFNVLFSSCNVVKRVEKGQYLVEKNTIIEDGKINKSERLNSLVIQKVNSGMEPLFGMRFPLRLHIFNLARPNIDSVLNAKTLSKPNKVKRKINLLSKKQFNSYLKSRRNFNSWLKKTGEAPVLLDEDLTKRTASRIRGYYKSKGWLDAKVNYVIKIDSSKIAQIEYDVIKQQPYILDSITALISSPLIAEEYSKIKSESLLKKGEQLNYDNLTNERERISSELRNSGFYNFEKDYIRFETDTIGTNQKVFTDLVIRNRIIKREDSIYSEPFRKYNIKEVNIYTDENFSNRNSPITDTVTYKGFRLFSKNGFKYRPKALTDAVFIQKGELYSDLSRNRTLRYINDLQIFRYPNIEYIEKENDTTLVANIYLEPRKKYDLGFDFDVSQSNIQTLGFSFSTGLRIRNVFKGAETLEISGVASIGASKDASNSNDAFFDINEFGGNVRLTIPRLFTPFNTDKIIPKFMSPSTAINISATSQQNIGLDKQTLSGILSYNWQPSKTITNNLELFNIEYVRNLNTDNYFGVYSNSFERLNEIARDISYIDSNETLEDPGIPNRFTPADTFIDDVLNSNTSLVSTDPDFISVSNIDERRNRLTEDNLIFSTSFNYKKDKRTSVFDNNFSVFKGRIELAGNMLSNLSNLFGSTRNNNGDYEVFGVAFSQYIKTELDYVKYFDLGRKSVFAFRAYAGIALPYGNSESIPFTKSFFAGGPNDNRAWTAYNLGPGSSRTTNEFNEANFKLHFSAEQRFNLFGSLRGALFVDVGNIWNVADNVDESAATFTNFDSLEDIAVGSGVGLRYDFDFFVLRFDTGFKTYNPALDIGNRWLKDFNFRSAVYNIGINYPF